MVDPFGWHVIDANTLGEVRARLASFESMTWNEILYAYGSPNHRVQLHRLCQDARDRLVAINQDDIDSLISLRVQGKPRVWGILDGSVLVILWWDPEHLVCPSLKKYT